MDSIRSPPPPKRRKLDQVTEDEFVLDANLLPDILLVHILRSVPDVRERMHLSFVCKRFRRLVHSKPMWTDINQLSVALGGYSAAWRKQMPEYDLPERNAVINGHRFGQQKRIRALEIFLDVCAPFSRIHIEVDRETRDLQWMKLLLSRFLAAQSAPNNHPDKSPVLKEISFQGSQHYIATVLGNLVANDGTKQKLKIHIRPIERKVDDQKVLWSKITACSGLTELEFKMVSGANDAFAKNAVAALSHKEHLRTLTLGCEYPDHWKAVPNTAAIVNACPSLTQLRLREYFYNSIDSLGLVNSLNPETLERLEHFDINFAFKSDPAVLPLLPAKLPNLTYSMVNIGGRKDIIVQVVKSFLDAWCWEESSKIISLDFKWVSLDHSLLFTALLGLCDCVVMATDSRVAFVKGDAVVACKFISKKEDE